MHFIPCVTESYGLLGPHFITLKQKKHPRRAEELLLEEMTQEQVQNIRNQVKGIKSPDMSNIIGSKSVKFVYKSDQAVILETHQFGAGAKLGTETLHHIIKKALKDNPERVRVKVDYKNAFNKPKFQKLWKEGTTADRIRLDSCSFEGGCLI